ncbi:mitochondrial glyco protein [Suhomyces tanzawaensis NRRL Y-17324]|uniref:Mitochondrial glyco protein n=1 Tax=Suhomyces tanzawaensis NRRL Y-17324 TaxID=984487 RepID=A0A1E4SJP8_9ASCO|nr:mitochondrial glyco protein [Suhomyces tanzawaensis NRRL Y-17324]ODV79731.1 mitochondrial glyco protein [Suhomyces tanzawaensis NRRL Y-17324]
MSSLRILSRALRAESNAVAAVSRRCSVRVAVPAIRAFSQARVQHADSGKKLQEVLKSELKISKAIPNDLESTYQEFLDQSGFQVVASEGNSNVELVKTLDNGEIVRVFFDIDEVTDSPMPQLPEGEEFGETFEEEADALDSMLCNVKVVIEKSENNTGLLFNLYLQNTESSFMIDFVLPKNNIKEFLASKVAQEGEFADKFQYQGPRFSDLDESVQTEFEGYLSTKGLNEDLADFIVAFSENKEENEYRGWLSNLVKFFN